MFLVQICSAIQKVLQYCFLREINSTTEKKRKKKKINQKLTESMTDEHIQPQAMKAKEYPVYMLIRMLVI